MNGNTNNNPTGSYAEEKPRILGDDEYPTEGQKPVLEEGELTEEDLDAVQASANYKEWLDQLTLEQLQYVKSSGLLTQSEAQVIDALNRMIEENNQRMGR